MYEKQLETEKREEGREGGGRGSRGGEVKPEVPRAPISPCYFRLVKSRGTRGFARIFF